MSTAACANTAICGRVKPSLRREPTSTAVRAPAGSTIGAATLNEPGTVSPSLIAYPRSRVARTAFRNSASVVIDFSV